MPTQPYLSACVIGKNNRDTLPALLDSVIPYVDEVVYTDTGSTDGSADYAAERGCKVSHFGWVDDFASARNFCFAQATGRWRAFLDTDDVLENGEALIPQLLKLEAESPAVEGVFVPYNYDHLERLDTMRLVRWRPGWRFVDAIHERLEFESELPQEAFVRATAFGVKHKPKTPEEKQKAIQRNARIAEREWARTDIDAKYRARLGRTLAMELKTREHPHEHAPKIVAYLKPLTEMYSHYPEGRQAAADISRAYLSLGAAAIQAKDMVAAKQHQDAVLVWAKKAGPSYEAVAHHFRGELKECVKAVQRAAGVGRQGTLEDGLAYLCAADAALDLGMDPAVAERLLNRIPVEIRLEKQIHSLAQQLRKGIDRITILVPGTPQPFDESGGGGMLGGSEEAVMYLVAALRDLGRNVRVYAPLPPQRIPGPDARGVDWQEASTFNYNDEHGTLVLWRAPGVVLQLLQAKQQAEGKNMPGINGCFLWLHDAGLGISKENAHVVGQVVNGAVVLSEYHARAIREAGFTGGLTVLSNGIPEIACGTERDPNRVVYSSCPSRGLVPLLEMWPAVKAACPDAYLDVYYDWGMLERAQPDLYVRIREAYDEVSHLQVKHHGGVDHETLHAALQNCNVWAYSHFESPLVETSCVSLMKAAAAGATILTVPNGALPETGDGLAEMIKTPQAYQKRLIECLTSPEGDDVRQRRSAAALDRFEWHRVARRFSDLWRI
jgi:glycosyltransferase involved in cell wall biosynthesis